MEMKIVPGLYASIEDYNLKIEETRTLKDNCIIFLCDLPDFIYMPDETSTEVNAIKKVRIPANQVMAVSKANALIQTLTGKNILDGILSTEELESLNCKEIINILKMSEELADAGEMAVVKIVKKDGHRPDMNNKFEVYQALENCYEQLGTVKCSQLVPVGISADEDFVTGEEKKPIAIIRQEPKNGYVDLKDKIFVDNYSFNPVQNYPEMKVELSFINPDLLNHEGSTPEQQLIKKEGLDSEKISHLLKGEVKVNGVSKVKDVQLKLVGNTLAAETDVYVELIKGEANIIISAGTPFVTISVTEVGGKKVAALDKNKKPLLNYYEAYEIKPEVVQFEPTKYTCKANEEIEVVGKLKETSSNFAATLTGEHVEVVEEISLQADGITFQGKIKFTAEGQQKVTLTVAEPYVPYTKELTFTVSGTVEPSPVKRKVARKDVPTVMSVTTVLASGENQYVLVGIEKPTSNWINVKNLGNKKEVVDKIAILEGKKGGVEQFKVTSSGTLKLTFENVDETNYKCTVYDLSEELDPKEFDIKVEGTDEIVLAEDTYLELENLTILLYKGLLIDIKNKEQVMDLYFDRTVDTITAPEYVINYVPKNSEQIARSLQFVEKQVSELSETLLVWGVKPPMSTDTKVVDKYVKELVNKHKFVKGFKVRKSASKEVDYGMFLSVVVGPTKKNNVGGISNFKSYRVLDFEREQGGIGPVKKLTNKVFVNLNGEFYTNSNVELRTFVGVKEKVVEAIVLGVSEVNGMKMLTLDKEIDTDIFNLTGFEVMIANTDSKDRVGSYSAALFAMESNKEKDRSPVQKDISSATADIAFSQANKELLLKNKFTVIDKNVSNGVATIVDTPIMTRNDSDYQFRSSIGSVLYLLKATRKVANENKGKRFPTVTDKTLLHDSLKQVFIDEKNSPSSLINAYEFYTDMSRLDSKGYLGVKFRIQDSKKLKVVNFAGGLARLTK